MNSNARRRDRTRRERRIHWLLVLWPMAVLLAALEQSSGWSAPVDFDKQIAPLFTDRCLECHAGADPKGKLDLSRAAGIKRGGASGEPAVVAGKPDESLLWQFVDSDEMPPNHPLSTEERAILHRWIQEGAHWGTDPIDPLARTTSHRAGRDWWALQPLKRTAPPAILNHSAIVNPIDQFIQAQLERRGLQPALPADRRTLIRRLSFDLLGLPPSPEEIAEFENDDSPTAYEHLVDRLLASPHQGVRWARRWLDLVRFGESHGFEHDEFRPNAWPYRDWVMRAFNQDLPYDQFVRLQVAGDVSEANNLDAIAATGFLVAGAYDSVGQSQQSLAMKQVVRQDELEDIVGTLGQTFLGITIHCSRCHDHKFDPITQTDYYRMACALEGVRHGERDVTGLTAQTLETRRAVGALARQIQDGEDRLIPRPAESIAPLLRWDFDLGAIGPGGQPLATVFGDARWTSDGLVLSGAGHASHGPLPRSVRARTLEVLVRLSQLNQRGGAAVSLQARDGQQFDAIVFGEREPNRWMAGSEGFQRSESFQGDEESEAHQRFVHLAWSYDADGSITAYRDGTPYGRVIRPGPALEFPGPASQVLFGLRHAPPGGNRYLSGTIRRARLYDVALTAEQVRASFQRERAIMSINDVGLIAARSRLHERLSQLARTAPGGRSLVYAVSPRVPEPTFRLLRGNPKQPAERVSPGAIASVIGPNPDWGLSADASDAQRRKALALWLTDPANPLFARVIVNRLWQSHFGVGLVETPSDFGFNGGRPSHPELLDWLATRLIEHGWSLKDLRRLILTSAAYRRGTREDASSRAVDVGNRLLWRKSPMRLEAEMVRDAMLAISGRLNPLLGGPGFREFTITQARGTITNRYTWIDQPEGADFDRRSLFRVWARGGRNPFLDVFDCPDPSTTTPVRAATTTPLQALSLLNDALVLRLADAFALRTRSEAGETLEKQIQRGYRLALGRSPTASELNEAMPTVERYGMSTLARALFNSNEFVVID